jgi:L-alanine-DL-glutamate epimerase-like enolase superfamily enzyme
VKITAIDCHVLLVPNLDVGSTSSAQEDIVVEIHTDEGVTGIGESDVNPWIARACIEAIGTHTMGQGLAEMLIGENPLEVERLWDKLYIGSAMNGRRGVMIHALGALDIALHDLRGKWLGKPCYAVPGEPVRASITPYASLQPEPETPGVEAYQEALVAAVLAVRARGFRAAKVEVTYAGPYRHMGLSASFDKVTETLAAVRSAVGPDFTLMVDVQYSFPDADTCLRVIRDWQAFNLFFIETPLPSDDLPGYARLATEQPIRIAAGEWLATRFEFQDLMDRGLISVAQPDIGRVGGITEARRVCDMARARKRLIVPHAWKTGITITAAAHVAALTPHCPYIEFLPAELSTSVLRREVVRESFAFVDGHIVLSSAPGLGLELNRDALESYRVP